MDSSTLLYLLSAALATFFYFHLSRKSSSSSSNLPPGPRGLPILGCIPFLGPSPHHSLLRLSSTYGPLLHLRIGSIPTIVVSSSQTAELFLKTHDIPFANRPPSEIFHCISYGLKGFAFAEYGPYWRHIRKLCVSHLLSAPKIASFRQTRAEEVTSFMQRLAKTGKPVNVSMALGDVVSDVVCRMILGRKFEDEEGMKFKERTRELMGLLSAFNINDFIPVLGVFDFQRMRKRMREVHVDFDGFLEKNIEEHLREMKSGRRKEEGEKDFVDVMLAFMESGKEVAEGIRVDRTTVKAIVLV